jgi:membrane-associated phospholipid phosphatase
VYQMVKNNYAKLIIAGVILIAAVALIRGWMPERPSYPDIFAQHDVTVAAGERWGTVLVVNSNAQVAGTVNRLIVLNGNLMVTSSGRLEGLTVVLGGNLFTQEGAYVWQALRIVLADESKVTGIIVGSLLLLLIVGLPAVAWPIMVATRHLQGIPVYHRLEKNLLFLEQRKTWLFLLLGLTVSAVMLTAFFHLAEEAVWAHEMDLFDSISVWVVRYYASPTLDKIMLGFTDIGSAYFYGLVTPVLLLGLAVYRRWWDSLAVSFCLGGGSLLNILLKNIFARSRPDVLPIIAETGYSFPSGHAMVALCFYGIAAFLLSRLLPTLRGKVMVFILTGVLVMLIGISRIYLGVHYPSDVLAGYFAGSTWLAVCISVLKWWEL